MVQLPPLEGTYEEVKTKINFLFLKISFAFLQKESII